MTMTNHKNLILPDKKSWRSITKLNLPGYSSEKVNCMQKLTLSYLKEKCMQNYILQEFI